MTDRELKQLRLLIIAGVVTASIIGVLGQAYSTYRSQTKIEARLDVVDNRGHRDALRAQANAHDIACALDSLREAYWQTHFPGKPPPYSRLQDRIPDIPKAERDRVNEHIGDVQLR